MKKFLSISIILIVLLAQSLFIFPIQRAQAFNYVTYSPSTQAGDCAPHNLPTQTFPAKWGTYSDPVFNTTIRRFTDFTADGSDRGVIQYTTFSNTNFDGTKVVFGLDNTTKIFYDNNGNYLRTVDFATLTPKTPEIEFRWSRTDPDIGYFRERKMFRKYTFSTGKMETIRDFESDFPGGDYLGGGISNDDKGEQSWDNRYWAFRVMRGEWSGSTESSYLVSYDLQTNTVYSINLVDLYNAQGWSIDGTYPTVRWVTMSPSGKYLIAKMYSSTWGRQGIGILLFQRSGNSSLVYVRPAYGVDNLGYDIGHPAWGYDADGYESLYWVGVPWFSMAHLDTGIVYNYMNMNTDCSLADVDYTYSGGQHLSTSYNRKTDGWIFLTAYTNNPTSIQGFWLERELFALRVSADPTKVKVWRIASTRAFDDGNYANQARAQISPDGLYIYFDSNWLNTQPREIFRAELPPTWYSDLALSAPTDTTPPAAPTGVTVN